MDTLTLLLALYCRINQQNLSQAFYRSYRSIFNRLPTAKSLPTCFLCNIRNILTHCIQISYVGIVSTFIYFPHHDFSYSTKFCQILLVPLYLHFSTALTTPSNLGGYITDYRTLPKLPCLASISPCFSHALASPFISLPTPFSCIYRHSRARFTIKLLGQFHTLQKLTLSLL